MFNDKCPNKCAAEEKSTSSSSDEVFVAQLCSRQAGSGLKPPPESISPSDRRLVLARCHVDRDGEVKVCSSAFSSSCRSARFFLCSRPSSSCGPPAWGRRTPERQNTGGEQWAADRLLTNHVSDFTVTVILKCCNKKKTNKNRKRGTFQSTGSIGLPSKSEIRLLKCFHQRASGWDSADDEFVKDLLDVENKMCHDVY